MDGIYIGPLLLPWGGILISLGVATGLLIFALEIRRRKLDPEIVYYLFMPLLIWGLIGARLWHIFTPPLSSVVLDLTTENYLSHPLDILAFWLGGFGLPGAFLVGTVVLFLFSRKYDLPFFDLADAAAPGIVTAQVIGRLSNFFNQELYGPPTHLPWGILIEPASRLPGYEQVEIYHPLFAYEMILNLVSLAVLIWLSRKYSENLLPGDIFFVCFANYSVIRFLLEFLRLDVASVGGVNVNQVFFALLFFVVVAALLWRRRIQVL